MARSVTISEEAFRALREEKREGESDSDVLLRLRREAHSAAKDGLRFLRTHHEPLGGSWDAAEKAGRSLRETDRRSFSRRARR